MRGDYRMSARGGDPRLLPSQAHLDALRNPRGEAFPAGFVDEEEGSDYYYENEYHLDSRSPSPGVSASRRRRPSPAHLDALRNSVRGRGDYRMPARGGDPRLLHPSPAHLDALRNAREGSFSPAGFVDYEDGSGYEGSGYEGSGYEGSGYEGSGYEGSGYEGSGYDTEYLDSRSPSPPEHLDAFRNTVRGGDGMRIPPSAYVDGGRIPGEGAYPTGAVGYEEETESDTEYQDPRSLGPGLPDVPASPWRPVRGGHFEGIRAVWGTSVGGSQDDMVCPSPATAYMTRNSRAGGANDLSRGGYGDGDDGGAARGVYPRSPAPGIAGRRRRSVEGGAPPGVRAAWGASMGGGQDDISCPSPATINAIRNSRVGAVYSRGGADGARSASGSVGRHQTMAVPSRPPKMRPTPVRPPRSGPRAVGGGGIGGGGGSVRHVEGRGSGGVRGVVGGGSGNGAARAHDRRGDPGRRGGSRGIVPGDDGLRATAAGGRDRSGGRSRRGEATGSRGETAGRGRESTARRPDRASRGRGETAGYRLGGEHPAVLAASMGGGTAGVADDRWRWSPGQGGGGGGQAGRDEPARGRDGRASRGRGETAGYHRGGVAAAAAAAGGGGGGAAGMNGHWKWSPGQEHVFDSSGGSSDDDNHGGSHGLEGMRVLDNEPSGNPERRRGGGGGGGRGNNVRGRRAAAGGSGGGGGGSGGGRAMAMRPVEQEGAWLVATSRSPAW